MRRFSLGIILLLSFLLSGCVIESRNRAGNTNLIEPIIEKDFVQAGDWVEVQYRGALEDGFVFDTTLPGRTRAFQVGIGQLIIGFDSALLGMRKGESKHFVIPPAQAYGEYDESLIQVHTIQEVIDNNVPLALGAPVLSQGLQGIIIDINEDTNSVTFDFNPRLAGKTLVFDVNVVRITNKNPDSG